MTRIKWSARRVLPYVAGGLAGAVWILLVKAGFASANDCIEYVKSMKNLVGAPKGVLEDCMRTGWVQGTITSIIAAIGGGAIAVGVGTALTQPGDEEKKPEEPPPGGRPDPCQGAQDGYNQAKLHQDVLLQAYTSWQGTLKQLEDMYWQVNSSGYYSGVIDVGFLAGSVWGKVMSGGINAAWKTEEFARYSLQWAMQQGAKEYLKDSFKQKLFEAAIKSFIKGSLKDYSKYMEEIYGKQGMDVGKKAIQEAVKEGMISSAQKAAEAAGEPFDKTFYKDNVAGAYTDFAGNLLSLGSMGSGVYKSAQNLEKIRGLMSEARARLFEAEQKLQDAGFEMERANDNLKYCHNGDEYGRYLKNIEFSKLRSQG